MMDRRALLHCLPACALAWQVLPARAQDAAYPNKPIRVVPFGTAGGPIDSIARVYGERLTQRWGQTVIVDAKPGASGILAADFVAKSPPDGYTLMLTLSLTHTTVPLLQTEGALRPAARLPAADADCHRRPDADRARRQPGQQPEGVRRLGARPRAV